MQTVSNGGANLVQTVSNGGANLVQTRSNGGANLVQTRSNVTEIPICVVKVSEPVHETLSCPKMLFLLR